MGDKRKLFGTDGVRGIANVEPVTAETALKLGRAAAHVLKKDARRYKVVVGKDTRLSGYMLENAIVAGLTSMGVDVLLIGPLPTPGVAYITRSLRADAGIVITASHNTYEDNGIKFFNKNGTKLDDKISENNMSGGFAAQIGVFLYHSFQHISVTYFSANQFSTPLVDQFFQSPIGHDRSY